MAEGRIPAGGVHGSGVLVERGMRLGNAEVVGRGVPWILGMVVWVSVISQRLKMTL